ncbi:restriction endonuclease subunit S [Avibacterium gallinarum]|uniref:restriction endonuclease subunit S n=1 Tax=Avibacterium gallinarum TaxID=755 RepID=UPI0039FC3532
MADVIDSLHKTPVYADKGLSMCRVTDIKGGFLNLEETFKVSEEVFAEFTKRYTPKKYDLVMSRVGSYGNVSIVPLDDAVCMGQNTVVIHSHINSKFMYYFLTSKSAQEFIEKNVGGGNQKTLSLKAINLIPIPLPPIEEQKRIAGILDKFHTLAHSLSEGLPKEIALRQKQYAYYRDLLLGFEK